MPRADLTIPALTETPIDGPEPLCKSLSQPPMPEFLPDGAWGSEEASALLRNREGMMMTGMVTNSMSTESSGGKYCEIRSGGTIEPRFLAV